MSTNNWLSLFSRPSNLPFIHQDQATKTEPAAGVQQRQQQEYVKCLLLGIRVSQNIRVEKMIAVEPTDTWKSPGYKKNVNLCFLMWSSPFRKSVNTLELGSHFLGKARPRWLSHAVRVPLDCKKRPHFPRWLAQKNTAAEAENPRWRKFDSWRKIRFYEYWPGCALAYQPLL